MMTLKELRITHGLSQKELANLFGISERTVQNIESDSSNIKDSLLSKYIKAFNIGYDDIFLGNKYENIVFMNKKKEKVIYTYRLNTESTFV